MKKLILLLLLVSVSQMFSQDLRKKIPSNASFVIEFDGEKLSEKVIVSQLNKYSVFENMNKEFSKDSDFDFSKDLGFDFDKSFFIYGDDKVDFAAIVPLKDADKFNSFLKKKNEIKPYKKTNFKGNEKIIFNDKFAIFYELKRVRVSRYSDEVKKEYDRVRAEQKDKKEYDYKLRREIADRLEKEKKEVNKLAFFENVVSGKNNSNAIFRDKKSKADVFSYLNYSRLMSNNFIELSFLFRKSNFNINGMKTQYKFVSNGFFKDDEIKVVSEMIPGNKHSKNMIKSIYDAKINKNLLKYINPENIAYFTSSVNSEAVINQYYSYFEDYLGGFASDKMSAHNRNLIIETFKLFIDEKALAEVLSGDAIMVLDDVRKKQIEYKSYKYDKEYNRTETIKTKEEIVPEFTFLFTTENENYIKKLFKAPDLKNKPKDFMCLYNDDIYHLMFKNEYIEDVFYSVKNGIVMMTTSEKNINNFRKNKTYKLSKEDKKLITKNNIVIKVNPDKINADLIKLDGGDDKLKTMMKSFYKNDFVTSGKVSGGRFIMNSTMKIKENDKENSLIYMIDLIDKIYTNDDQKRRKKYSNATIDVYESDAVGVVGAGRAVGILNYDYDSQYKNQNDEMANLAIDNLDKTSKNWKKIPTYCKNINTKFATSSNAKSQKHLKNYTGQICDMYLYNIENSSVAFKETLDEIRHENLYLVENKSKLSQKELSALNSLKFETNTEECESGCGLAIDSLAKDSNLWKAIPTYCKNIKEPMVQNSDLKKALKETAGQTCDMYLYKYGQGVAFKGTLDAILKANKTVLEKVNSADKTKTIEYLKSLD